jgi:hypothetical protein
MKHEKGEKKKQYSLACSTPSVNMFTMWKGKKFATIRTSGMRSMRYAQVILWWVARSFQNAQKVKMSMMMPIPRMTVETSHDIMVIAAVAPTP